MYRLTTPQHYFTFPEDPSIYKTIVITYYQGDRIVLEKYKEDMTFTGNVGVCNLTQDETKLFYAGNKVRLQVRALTETGDAFASDIFTLDVKDVLNDGVLS